MKGIALVEGEWDPAPFLEAVLGFEGEREGGARCFLCYEIRLFGAAKYAKENGFDYFATTLKVSPHKNAQKLNEIGLRLAREVGVRFLPTDFKKRGGYQRSVELSKEYGLYRQDYCGCRYSART
jgi:predicted adenine nucleotide alpha hydrolase (AANH) superfamily ATPase